MDPGSLASDDNDMVPSGLQNSSVSSKKHWQESFSS